MVGQGLRILASGDHDDPSTPVSFLTCYALAAPAALLELWSQKIAPVTAHSTTHRPNRLKDVSIALASSRFIHTYC